MKKVLFLSSALIMTNVGAYAADELITGGAGTCTVDVLGVSDNNATANTIAVWSINEYTLAPGEYLSVTETSVDKTTCPAGSYCVGGAGFTVDNATTSIEQCPAEHPNSRAGAGAQNQCYTACTVTTANIAHATAVGGNDYFGDGADACYATACATGYHIDGDVELVEKDPLIPVDYTVAGNAIDMLNGYGNRNRGSVPFFDAGLISNNTWAVNFNYGTIYGKASCQPKMNSALEYIATNIDFVMGGTMTLADFKVGLEPLAGKPKTEYLMDMISGNKSEEELYKVMSGLFGLDYNANYSTDGTGQHCYCQMDGFAPTGGERSNVLSAPWAVIPDSLESDDTCTDMCSGVCAAIVFIDSMEGRVSRAVLFGTLSVSQNLICAANTINIDWNPDNGGEHTKNMCTYDGEITLPTPDPVKPGYTFTGWKLLEETTTTE